MLQAQLHQLAELVHQQQHACAATVPATACKWFLLHFHLPNLAHMCSVANSFFFFKILFLFIHRDTEKEREAETQAEGEAGSTQGSQRGT